MPTSREFSVYGVKVCSSLCRERKKDDVFMRAYGNKPMSVDIEESKYPTFVGVDLASGPDHTVAMRYSIERRIFDAFVMPPMMLDYKSIASAYTADQTRLKCLTAEYAKWQHPAAAFNFKRDRSGAYGLWRADHKPRSRGERKAIRRRKAKESRLV